MTVSFCSWEQFRVARFGNGLYDVFSILIVLNLNWNMRTNLPLNNSLLVSTDSMYISLQDQNIEF